MIVLASDYEDQLLNSYEVTKEAIIKGLGSTSAELEFYVEAYGTEKFWDLLSKADGLITAFIPVDNEFLNKAPKLKFISVNATGYNSIDLIALSLHRVEMSHITSYCTREVAEHAISMVMALNKMMPEDHYDICREKKWKYMDRAPRRTVNHLTLTIFGLGRIGQVTAKLANALGMKVQAVDPYATKKQAFECNAKLVTKEVALETSDVIINHMVLNDSTRYYFNEEFFEKLKRKPIFVNVGRGGSVSEKALLEALESGKIASAGLDVLEDENPNLEKCPFVGLPNVLLTPHSAFYSEDSNRELEVISGRNMGMYLAGNMDKIQGLIRCNQIGA